MVSLRLVLTRFAQHEHQLPIRISYADDSVHRGTPFAIDPNVVELVFVVRDSGAVDYSGCWCSPVQEGSIAMYRLGNGQV